MECVHNERCTADLYIFFVVFYLYNVHIKECTFDIFDKPILQVQLISYKRYFECKLVQGGAIHRGAIDGASMYS